jgi:hypothetical protein
MTSRLAISISVLSIVSVAVSACSSTPDERAVQSQEGITLGDVYNFGAIAHPGSCMDVQAAGTANGTQIQEYACNGTPAQSFALEDAGGGTYKLVGTATSKCVDVNAQGTANGTKVQLWDCNGTPAQSFSITDAGSGFITFVNTHSGKCLDVAGDNPSDGTVVQLWDCNGTNAQKWNPAVIGGSGPGPVGGGSGNMTVANHCGYTVWVGVQANAGDPLPASGGFQLNAGTSYAFDTPFTNGAWGGRVWGRTECTAAGTNCATGNCGQTQCGGNGGAPPATLAEFTIVQGGTTFYDVSLVDGYNLQMQVSGPGCPTIGCTSDLNAICPSALQQRDGSGNVVACRSDCEQYNTDADCCRSGPAACQANPPPDAHIFKSACPQAYSYAYDDATSTFTCVNQTNYTVTFCP